MKNDGQTNNRVESKFKRFQITRQQQAKAYDLTEEHHKTFSFHDKKEICPHGRGTLKIA